jgi:hypothetical protein
MHDTPIPRSRINQVERFFALLTDDPIRRSAHRSTAEPGAPINAFLDAHNADLEPFRWA